ncbi:MAG: sulfatase-like hydrolase/transferase [bacterium]|nr:sulfatase-like hydrolase/transferase [bacterium]MDD4459496.1 sulfatase-like hydrolase/transferase [Proteiniphilum sp.]
MNDRILLGLLAGSTLLGGCREGKQKIADARPNVVLIYADDLGIGDLSCYGAAKIETPHLDSLAEEGIKFTNAFSTSAMSTPSRYGLLTGIYPWRKENTGIAPGNSGLLIDTATVTIADIFQRAGYATAAIGKWHLGLGPSSGPDFNGYISPNTRDIGFDYEFLIPATVDRVPCVFVEDGRVVNLDPADPIQVDYEKKVGNWPTGEENPELLKMKPSQGHNNTIVNGISRIGYMTGGTAALWKDEQIAHTILNQAEQFITNNREHPFFLFLGTHDIHVPRVPHPDFKGKSGMGDRGDVILQLDWTVGRIRAILQEKGLLENTLIIFSSDNGAVIDDGYQDKAFELLNGHTPMGIYRGGKYSLYDAGTRVPFIVYWQDRIKAGLQEGRFSQIDLFRSLAALVHQSPDKHIAFDSRNRIDILLGEADADRDFVVQQNLNNTLGIIHEEWKYMEASNHPERESWTRIELGNHPRSQLYQIREDPSETTNVAEQHPEVLKKMATALDSIRTINTMQP